MNAFDDNAQIEEIQGFDFQESCFDDLFEEDEDDRTFKSYMNSNIDY